MKWEPCLHDDGLARDVDLDLLRGEPLDVDDELEVVSLPLGHRRRLRQRVLLYGADLLQRNEELVVLEVLLGLGLGSLLARLQVLLGSLLLGLIHLEVHVELFGFIEGGPTGLNPE